MLFYFQFPFRRLSRSAWIWLILLNVCLPAAASPGEVQQAENARQLIKKAEKLTRRGSLPEAESLLRQVVEKNPLESKAKLGLSYVLLKSRKLNEAYNLAELVAASEPKNARAFAMLGMVLLEFGSFKTARIALNNAYFLDSKEPLGWFGAGMLDFYENRISDSLPKLEVARNLAPDEPDFVFASAQVLARSEKYKEAAAAFRLFMQISPISDTDRRARIKGLIGFLDYIGDRQELYVTDHDVKQTTVPLELSNLRPILEIGVGDSGEKFRFVLDTGSGISVISEPTARRLNIKPIARGGSARAIGGDGKFEIVYGFLKSIRIGDSKIRNVPVYIRKFHGSNEDIDGYIGLSLISKFLTTIDYGNQTFTLTRKEHTAAVQPLEKDALAMPLRLTSSGFLSGEVQIEGVESPLNFIVDTGASVSVISDSLSKTETVNRFLINEKMNVIGAAGITENVSSFVLPRVSFGKNSCESVKAIALNLDIINEAAGFEQAGILGGNFLKNYRLTFDFQNSKVTFTPVDKK